MDIFHALLISFLTEDVFVSLSRSMTDSWNRGFFFFSLFENHLTWHHVNTLCRGGAVYRVGMKFTFFMQLWLSKCVFQKLVVHCEFWECVNKFCLIANELAWFRNHGCCVLWDCHTTSFYICPVLSRRGTSFSLCGYDAEAHRGTSPDEPCSIHHPSKQHDSPDRQTHHR